MRRRSATEDRPPEARLTNFFFSEPGPVQENSWRAGLLDDKGKIRYGWGNVAKTFGEDPRWTDYITEVRCGDNPNLTWEQYVDALITRDGQAIYPNGHKG